MKETCALQCGARGKPNMNYDEWVEIMQELTDGCGEYVDVDNGNGNV